MFNLFVALIHLSFLCYLAMLYSFKSRREINLELRLGSNHVIGIGTLSRG